MGNLDLEKIRQAWREVPDADVARGVRHVEDYPPEVQVIIEEEVQRRGLDASAFEFDELHERDAVTRLAYLTRRHPLVFAACLGFGFLPCLWIVNVVWLGIPAAIAVAVIVTLYLLGLAWGAWPLRRHKPVAQVAFAAWCGQFVLGLVVSVPSLPQIDVRSLLVFWAMNVVYLWVVPFVVLGAVVYVRNRYWPVYPAGCCGKCGYDLRGLPLPRCPECGTPFDPKDAFRDGDTPQLVGTGDGQS